MTLLPTPAIVRRTLGRSRSYLRRIRALGPAWAATGSAAPGGADTGQEPPEPRGEPERMARPTDPAPSRDIPLIPRAPRAVNIPVYTPGAPQGATEGRVGRLSERVDVLAERLELVRQRLENQGLRLDDALSEHGGSYVSSEVRALAGRVAALEARLFPLAPGAPAPASAFADPYAASPGRTRSMVAPRREASDARDGTAVISGVFPELSLTTLLSLFELERSEGVLVVQSGESRLEIELRGGVAARSFLDLRRMPLVAAVREALAWETGRFEFRKTLVSEDDADEPRSVNAIVLEASHLRDAAREAY